MHFDEEMGFKFLGPGSTVFSPSNKRPPTVGRGVSHVGFHDNGIESWLCCHAGRLEELLILNRHCRSGEDVKDSVLPRSYWQQWWNWDSTEKEVQNLATKTEVMWFERRTKL